MNKNYMINEEKNNIRSFSVFLGAGPRGMEKMRYHMWKDWREGRWGWGREW